MDDSILTSIKELLGISAEDTSFDKAVVMNINSALMIANQLGLGPEAGFSIKDESKTWADFIGARKDLEAIKTYIYQKVRLMFDPPQMGFLVTLIEQQCQEFEWRLTAQAEGAKSE